MTTPIKCDLPEDQRQEILECAAIVGLLGEGQALPAPGLTGAVLDPVSAGDAARFAAGDRAAMLPET